MPRAGSASYVPRSNLYSRRVQGLPSLPSVPARKGGLGEAVQHRRTLRADGVWQSTPAGRERVHEKTPLWPVADDRLLPVILRCRVT